MSTKGGKTDKWFRGDASKWASPRNTPKNLLEVRRLMRLPKKCIRQARESECACVGMTTLLLDYFGGVIEAEVADAVEQHLSTCSQCYSFLMTIEISSAVLETASDRESSA